MQMHDPSILFSGAVPKETLVPMPHAEKDDPFERKCSICLETMNVRTQPVSCQHMYCMECIYGWTKYNNACPLCKVTIVQLKVFDALEPDKVSELLSVPEPKQRELDANGDPVDDDANFAEVCYVCKTQKSPDEEERMLVCDNCDY